MTYNDIYKAVLDENGDPVLDENGDKIMYLVESIKVPITMSVDEYKKDI